MKLNRFFLMMLLPAMNAFAFELPELNYNEEKPGISWKPSAYLMLDYDENTTKVESEQDTDGEAEVRRGRLGINAKYRAHWRAELQLGFEELDDDYPEVKELRLTYKGLGEIDMSLGLMKVPFGLENGVSSRHLPFMERSMASASTSLGRAKGIKLEWLEKKWGFYTGYFDNSDWNDEIQDSVFRAYYTPHNKKKKQVHFGYSLAYRDWKKGNDRLSTRIGTNTAEPIRLDNTLPMELRYQNGIEIAVQGYGVLFQTEYVHQSNQTVNSDVTANTDYQFIYYQLAYFPFGGYRRYRDGYFKRVKGINSWTALELVIGKSEIDGFDNNQGTQIESLRYGLNYYPVEALKLSANMTEYRLDRPVTGFEQTGNAWSIRLQWEYRP